MTQAIRFNGRFDPESIRLSNDARAYSSPTIGPCVRQFDSATGQLVKTFTLPGNLNAPNLSPKGDVEISGNTVGRVANKGMEGLAITPDGKTLVGIMQAPLEQDAANPATANMVAHRHDRHRIGRRPTNMPISSPPVRA